MGRIPRVAKPGKRLEFTRICPVWLLVPPTSARRRPVTPRQATAWLVATSNRATEWICSDFMHTPSLHIFPPSILCTDVVIVDRDDFVPSTLSSSLDVRD